MSSQSGCKDLLKRFLEPDPAERVTLREVMHHPWITEGIAQFPSIRAPCASGVMNFVSCEALFPAGRNKPMEPAPFPNKLNADDLNHNIIKHMSQTLEYRMGDIIRLVTSNIPSSATATYHMFEKRLKAYEAKMRVEGRISAMESRRLSGCTSARVRIIQGHKQLSSTLI